MLDQSDSQTLSCVDAFFLYLEQPGTPLNVASVSVFEGAISLAECTRLLRSKMPLLPRFRQRVAPAALGLGLPTWQFDPGFDIGNHVREIALKRGGEAEFKAAVSVVLSANLPRNRPLWDVTLVHGLQSDRTGVIIRCHHCLVDGVAGVGMLKTLLDETPTTAARVRRMRSVPPPPEPRELTSVLLDGIATSCFTAAQALLNAHSEVLRMAQQFTAPRPPENGAAERATAEAAGINHLLGGSSQVGQLARAFSELARPVERMPFNTLCHGPQKFEWLELSMDEVTAVKQAYGGTVNDVVLATLTAALRRYAQLHGQPVKGRSARLVAPVNLRGSSEAHDTGNHITFLPIDIPLETKRPQHSIAAVQQQTRVARTAHAAELVGLVMTLLDVVPPAFQELIGSVLSQLPISLCNSICTNVHGPRTPLFLMGHKMLSSYPYVPIGGEIGMNCAVLSYNGTLCVGFTGDAKSIPDLERLPVFFRQSFEELKAAAHLQHEPKKKAPRPRAAQPRASAAAAKVSEEPPMAQAAAAAAGA